MTIILFPDMSNLVIIPVSFRPQSFFIKSRLGRETKFYLCIFRKQLRKTPSLHYIKYKIFSPSKLRFYKIVGHNITYVYMHDISFSIFYSSLLDCNNLILFGKSIHQPEYQLLTAGLEKSYNQERHPQILSYGIWAC